MMCSPPWDGYGDGHGINDVQETEGEDQGEGDFLLARHLQFKDDADRKRVGEEIGKDVECCVGEVEDIDVDADAVRDSGIPGCRNGPALECCGEDIGGGLAGDDAEHYEGHACQVFIPETGIEPADRCFDEAETGEIEHGAQPDVLLGLV